jgi:protein-tyrosine phosphatase
VFDLHSHILPGIDDGAKNADESERLIRMELDEGVNTIALTPHFSPEEQVVEEFVIKREEALERLRKVITESKFEVELVPASEVYISPKLLDIKDKTLLCYAGTDYMLVEFPTTAYFDWIPKVLFKLKVEGITPVIAHIERYPYVRQKIDIIYSLINDGMIIQANANSINDHISRRFIFKCLKHNLIHILASDTHSVKYRPPVLKKPMLDIERKFGKEYRLYLENNAKTICSGAIPDLFDPIAPSHKLFKILNKRWYIEYEK